MPRKSGPPKLPAKQLAILAICRFAEPVALTSVYPYLPEMIESFGIEKKEVAKWAGITSAVFSLSQCLTAVIWGRASDKFGRKPTILAGLTLTMFTCLIWGMSTTLPMAIVARAFAGGMNGNVGIIRTMVAEMVPEKELQPRAFSIMPLVWSLGSIFGPSFGGFFAKPAENMPALFGNSTFLKAYPFALPNIVASVLFLIGITTGILYLRETLESKKHRKDYGLVLGKHVNSLFATIFRLRPKPKQYRRLSGTYDEASSSLLRPSSSARSEATYDEAAYNKSNSKPVLPRPTLTEVFTYQSVINLTAYTFLALHSVAYDQLLPIFLHHPRQTPDAHNTHLPFKFSGGFGLGSGRIGTLFTLYGFVGCFIQFLIFPPTARRYGVLNCFKCCALSFPLICIATPYTAMIQDPVMQQVVMFGIMVVKSFAVIFAFPCSIILLTNSAVSLRILGTLNGVAVSISAVGRAIGPAMSGAAFSWGLERGYIITPYFLLAFISAIGAVPIWWLVEMPGFSKTDDEEEDEEDSLLDPADDEVLNESERLISKTGDQVVDGATLDTQASGVGEEGARSRKLSIAGTESQSFLSVPGSYGSANCSPTRFGGRSAGTNAAASGIAELERRMSSPIGIRGGSVGPGGGRRLSNALAASNVGHGTGGTSFH